jgi:hypothetical protein
VLPKPKSTLVVVSVRMKGASDDAHVFAVHDTPVTGKFHGAKFIVEVVGERCVVAADTVTVPPKLLPETVEETDSDGALHV